MAVKKLKLYATTPTVAKATTISRCLRAKGLKTFVRRNKKGASVFGAR